MGSPAASRIENTGSIHSSSSTIPPRRTNSPKAGSTQPTLRSRLPQPTYPHTPIPPSG